MREERELRLFEPAAISHFDPSTVESESYPSLYRSADSLSAEYQKTFFSAAFWEIAFLVGGALISVIDSPKVVWAIAQALVLFGALGCAIYLFAARPDRHWYAARAVAESIKTATWRFVSRAEPFDHSETEDRAAFRNLLKQIVDQNRDVAQKLTKFLEGLQITDDMIAWRSRPLSERVDYYLSQRVKDQQEWYAKKAKYNRGMAAKMYAAVIVTNFLAIVAAVTKVSAPATRHWPTDLLIAIASGLFAWIQSKRYSELASSYALAAHEISLIREQAPRHTDDPSFSKFVGDTENAFSREHTQWVARKDE